MSSDAAPSQPSEATRPSNASLMLAYFAPLGVYVGVGLLPEAWLSRELAYGLRIGATLAALALVFRRYVPLRGPGSPAGSVAAGAAAGLAGTAIWVALKAPFYPAGGEAWTETAFALRLVASTLLPPVFEELLFRGFLLRLVIQWERARSRGSEDAFGDAFDRSNVAEVEPGAWTPLAVALSTLAFAAGHQIPGELAASLAYGLLMCGLWIVRRDLLSCVTAHAVTNLSLGLYVAMSGSWSLW